MTAPARADAPPRSRRTLLNVILALVGAALLLLTIERVGWSHVRASVSSLGWWYVAVIALGAGRFAARARAWQVAAGDAPLSFRGAFSAMLAGDALGNLTPLGLAASEPAKVLLVSRRLSTVEAVASVAAENAFYTGSVLLMIGAGALLFFERASVPPALAAGAQVVLALVLASALLAVWIARRQPALLSRGARAAARWTGRGATASDRVRDIELHLYAMLRWPWSRLTHLLGWEAVFHVAAVLEVWLVLQWLPGGAGVTLVDAFVLETAGRLIVVLFKFIPYRLGVDEAGTAIVARALALDPAIGVSLALVRRIRILCLNAVGLALLATRRR